MPKTREQNQVIKDERKATILTSALKLFAIRGYDSIVVGDITKEANCSHGLFYHYFASKREIFLELLSIAEKRTAEKRKNEQALDKTPAIDAIRLIASRMLEEIYQEGESPYFLYMFINMHLQKTIPEPPNLKLRGPKRPFFHFFVDLVARGQKEGDVTGGDPKEIAIIYFSIIKGLCYTRLNMKEKVPTKPSIDIVMNLFIRKGNQ